jgi:hypothetical protein
MKSHMLFLQCLLDDLGRWCCTSTTRDYNTITRRFEDEGESFITITLPAFCKDFERSLAEGRVAHDSFVGFRRRKGLPQFLGGFLELIFERSTGVLLDVPSVNAIWAVRQLTLSFSKIKHECSDRRTRAAFQKYVECESDVQTADSELDPRLFDDFLRIGRLMWGDLLARVDEDIYYDRILPHHGPGSTAERLSSNGKWQLRDWTRRLDEVFPTMEVLCPSWSLSLDRLSDLNVREPDAEIPVRVISVPKTQKTPRIIAIEPACMMFMQQAIEALIVKYAKSDKFGDFIRWDDQSPNQRMAHRGSIDGTLATLDLSEASDRVSFRHVLGLLANHPHLKSAVDATRSRTAEVPGHGVLRLTKFASMGSALCFPFEAMVFCTVVFLGIEAELRTQFTRKDISSFAGLVRVYGDDIIVPAHYVRSVTDHLEAFGFKVNSGKSFWTGKFRESCGKEFYAGVDVSVTRVRVDFPTSRRDVPEILGTISLRNHLYKAGLWRSTQFLDDLLERLIPFPYVEETSPLQGRVSFSQVEPVLRYDPDLHIPLVKGIAVTPRIPNDPLDDYGALLKCLTRLELQGNDALPSIGVEHLERSGRPRSVDIKTRVAPPF